MWTRIRTRAGEHWRLLSGLVIPGDLDNTLGELVSRVNNSAATTMNGARHHGWVHHVSSLIWVVIHSLLCAYVIGLNAWVFRDQESRAGSRHHALLPRRHMLGAAIWWLAPDTEGLDDRPEELASGINNSATTPRNGSSLFSFMPER